MTEPKRLPPEGTKEFEDYVRAHPEKFRDPGDVGKVVYVSTLSTGEKFHYTLRDEPRGELGIDLSLFHLHFYREVLNTGQWSYRECRCGRRKIRRTGYGGPLTRPPRGAGFLKA